MSDGNKGHNDDLQDYLDLLDAYSRRKQSGLEALREQEDKKIEEENLFSEEKMESRLDEQILYEQVAEKHRRIEERRSKISSYRRQVQGLYYRRGSHVKSGRFQCSS